MIFNLIFLSLFGIGFGVYLPGAIILATIQSRIKTYFAKRRIKNNTTLIAEYDIPNKLSPAMASYIYYGRCTYDTEKAILLELEALGDVSVKIEKGRLSFQKQADASVAREGYHQILFDRLPDSGTFEHNTLNPVDSGFISIQLRDKLSAQGYISGRQYTKRFYILCGIISAIVGIIMGIALAYTVMHSTKETGISYSVNGRNVDHFDLGSAIGFGIMFGIFTFVFSFLQVAIALGIYYRQLGIPKNATPKFKEVWTRILGYREYLKMVEQDNLQDDINTGQKTDQKLVAYAIGLNVVDI